MENNLVIQTNSVEINNEEYPKNTLAIEQIGDSVIVKTVSEGKTLGQGEFASWKTGGVPYASKTALITALRGALFG